MVKVTGLEVANSFETFVEIPVVVPVEVAVAFAVMSVVMNCFLPNLVTVVERGFGSEI